MDGILEISGGPTALPAPPGPRGRDPLRDHGTELLDLDFNQFRFGFLLHRRVMVNKPLSRPAEIFSLSTFAGRRKLP